MTPTDIPFATSSSYPARPGNQVRPLVDGEPIARRIGETVEKARHSVWLTVAFYSDDFRFPDGLGPLFDVLDRAVARGLDVRLLVWRPNAETRPSHRLFGGTAADRALLAKRGSRFRIRWDRAAAVFCQHQKSWVIDAGQPSETAFVGGLNLTGVAMQRHDVYVEVTGPSATDVHHNFVQRWNEASEREAPDGNWACDSTDALPFPDRPSEPRGSSTVQI
jgi:cardiolipin synthase A/B